VPDSNLPYGQRYAQDPDHLTTRSFLGPTPHDDRPLPSEAHRASAAEAEFAGASLFSDQPLAGPDVLDAGSTASGEASAGTRPTNPTAARRCTAIKPDGRPCGGLAQRNTDVCIFHDPTRAAEAAAARRLGGQHRRRVRDADLAVGFTGLGTTQEIRSILEIATRDVLDLEPSIPRSRVLIAASLAALRLLEVTGLATETKNMQTAYRAAGLLPDPSPIVIDVGEDDLPEVDG
jgi:hypothetical protein